MTDTSKEAVELQDVALLSRHLHEAISDRDTLAARVEELEGVRNAWRNDFRALEKAIVGDTGLSAMAIATQARKYRPRAEAAEANLAKAIEALDAIAFCQSYVDNDCPSLARKTLALLDTEAPAPEVSDTLKRENDREFWLGEILAVIHGDGGHHLDENGPEASAKEAIEKWYDSQAQSNAAYLEGIRAGLEAAAERVVTQARWTLNDVSEYEAGICADVIRALDPAVIAVRAQEDKGDG